MRTYHNESLMKYVKLKMPKFKVIIRNDYVDTFKHFGVTDIFDENLSDFGKMTDEKVFIGKLMQISDVVVDELGVNAAQSEDDIGEILQSDSDDDSEDSEERQQSETEDDEEEGQQSETDDDENEEQEEESDTDKENDATVEQSQPETAEYSESMLKQLLSDPQEFYVTKPFMFLIFSSQENVVLFSAIVTNPNAD
ncbi:hypothetical protein RF11_12385 [Thelohanellus kitauei]|uniref:Serpin domain-containing protein n=1 Tax=Thelohanellus kitauei TaxID=669202 RepID=A0A0C2MZW9_THEKT|nr:hypothetical protein RF11_12385 [Thelohanellus kitauei]